MIYKKIFFNSIYFNLPFFILWSNLLGRYIKLPRRVISTYQLELLEKEWTIFLGVKTGTDTMNLLYFEEM